MLLWIYLVVQNPVSCNALPQLYDVCKYSVLDCFWLCYWTRKIAWSKRTPVHQWSVVGAVHSLHYIMYLGYIGCWIHVYSNVFSITLQTNHFFHLDRQVLSPLCSPLSSIVAYPYYSCVQCELKVCYVGLHWIFLLCSVAIFTSSFFSLGYNINNDDGKEVLC